MQHTHCLNGVASLFLISLKSSPDKAVEPLCRDGWSWWKVNVWASILENAPASRITSWCTSGGIPPTRHCYCLLVRLLVLPSGWCPLSPTLHLINQAVL